MADYRGALTGGLDFINTFDGSIDVANQEKARAEALRRQADKLDQRYPAKMDKAIHAAAANLIELHQAGELTNEEVALGVLRINQNLPSRTIRPRGAPDVDLEMARFTAIEPGAPVVETHGNSASTFVVADLPVTLDVSLARGMGGLPEANVQIPAHKVSKDPVEDGQLALSQHIIALDIRIPQAEPPITIGRTAIQQLLDMQRFSEAQYDFTDTHKKIRAMSGAAANLAALGHVFDLAHITSTVKAIDAHESKLKAAAEESEDDEAEEEYTPRRRHGRKPQLFN